MYPSFFKRLVDIVISLFGIVLLFPLFLVITISLLIVNDGKPFFYQKRPGKDETIFTILKFKTMNDKKDENGKLLPDFQRMTNIGRHIRKYSLDEIPQLFSVLKGDMSLVGPRPLMVNYLPLYSEHQRKRHMVKPGITGWAQVNGRNSISWGEKFELDIFYVENISFLLDLKIMALTVVKVFKREGVNSSDSDTMAVFNGNN
ncbi:MAG: sugar transferase [Muricauda sp.]|nr:sugar transferase [Allomuricauda sp.]MBO6531950.1 sugar transferase [Allomuricauda sp.]MBO6590558.1 sugar transferase [Allomuricauda sp.]MBO6620130.1 sugar transferase [Allomuricauda sp.]MBO6646079.1 sugar transferase [Allomuricauda sp.]MBO6748522.1 sugar transferase [Allomuricauda sp.]